MPPGADEGAVDSVREDIDKVCDTFEAAWRSGGRPSLEAYLLEVPDGHRDQCLRELLYLELSYRRLSGEKPSPADYAGRFPENAELIDEVLRATTAIAASPIPGAETGEVRQLADPESAVAGDESGDRTVLAPGARLGHYEIEALVGEGGMGQVYRARDLRLLRSVAVKVLPREFARNREALARFEREGRTLAALHHRRLVTIHDFSTEGEMSYAVMELLEGETLRARLKRSPLSWEAAARICLAVAEGLAAAHSRGIVHRDLKPDNVFLAADGEIKILDFGLAHLKKKALPGATAAPDSSKTADGVILGTLPYMSPEQIMGTEIDERSDIFSFGSMLYEMLTGSAPFRGSRMPELVASILRDQPPSISSLVNAVPRELERIASRCLEKRAKDRFPSAGELTARLLEFVEARTPNARIGRRHWLAMGAATILLAALAGLLVYLSIDDLVQDKKELLAVSRLLDTEEQGKIEDGIRRIEELGVSGAGRNSVRALYLALLGRAHWQASSVSRSPDIAMEKAKKCALRACEIDPKCVEARIVLAAIRHRYDWDWAEAEREYRRIIEMGADSAQAHQEYGRFLMLAGDQASAREELGEASRIDPALKLVEMDIAESLYFEGDLDQAAHRLRNLGDSFEALWRLGEVLAAKGEFGRAAEKLETALRMGTKPHPEVRGELGYIYARAGEVEKARAALRRFEEEARDGYVPPVARAVVHIGLGEKKEAYAWLRKGVEERDEWLVYLKVDPVFASLRGEEEFQDLMRAAGIPR